LNEYKAGQAEGTTDSDALRGKMKKPPTGPEAAGAQKSTEDAGKIESEAKTGEKPQAKSVSPPSETKGGKSENPPSGSRSQFWENFGKNSQSPPSEPQSEFRM
jgi:hypothetical protein